MGENIEELSLLLKKITTLEFSNPKVSITLKKRLIFFFLGQNLFFHIFLIIYEDFTYETNCIIVKDSTYK